MAKFGPGDRWLQATPWMKRDRNDQERLRDSGCGNCKNKLAPQCGQPLQSYMLPVCLVATHHP